MSQNNNAANDILNLLTQARAQQEPPANTAAVANTNNSIRVTKDGDLVPPGAPIPADANGVPKPFSVVPSATFGAMSAFALPSPRRTRAR